MDLAASPKCKTEAFIRQSAGSLQPPLLKPIKSSRVIKMRQCDIILLAAKVVAYNLVVGGHAIKRYFHFDIYGSRDPQTRTGR